jgi:hypothetical protein
VLQLSEQRDAAPRAKITAMTRQRRAMLRRDCLQTIVQTEIDPQAAPAMPPRWIAIARTTVA